MQQNFKDYFIPHEGNDYTPHSLQQVAIVGMTLLVLLSFATANVQSLLWMSSDWLVSTVLPAVVVSETNEERAGGALQPLSRSATLDAAATLKAQHMAQNQYFAHYSPGGVSPWYWFSEVSYQFAHAGENLAIHFTDSAAVVDAWMNSPTHRANILNSNYTEIGVGAVEGTYEGFPTVYVVQLFGRPAVAVQPPAVFTESTVPAPPLIEETDEVVLAVTSSADTEEDEMLEELAVVLAQTTEDSAADDLKDVTQQASATPVYSAETGTFTATNSDVATTIEEIVVTNDTVALYANEVSTSTPLVPATTDTTTIAGTTNASSLLVSWATQPHTVLQFLYVAIGSFVVAALFLSILIEIRQQRPLQIVYGCVLLALMFGLYQIHTLLTAGAVVV